VGLPEKQQRALLFFLCERVPIAARVLIDGCVGESEAELKFGNRLPEHIKGDGRARLDLRKDAAEELAIVGCAV
jgi:hypothetical protein